MALGLGYELRRFRRELLVAIGVVASACGEPALEEGAEGSSSATSPTVGSSTDEGSGTSGPLEGPWCGLPTPADGGVPPIECEGSVAPPPQGQDDGWDRCDNMIHRRAQMACPLPDPLEGTCDPTNADAPECETDADCGPGGVCDTEFNPFAEFDSCGCTYPCESDSDCSDGQVCYCGPSGNRPRCITAYCTTDDDCEDGYACRLKNGELACDTPFDTCRSDGDCTGQECPSCLYDPASCGSQCVENASVCTVGRPFLVGGHERRAALAAGSAWSWSALDPHVDLCPEDRAALADHWADCGLMEHASVPAFARFALQLAAVGAPPHLLAATAAAMADEVEHAQACFGLARRYGRDVGPGPIDTAGVMDGPQDLATIAELAAVEACIGETLAAAEAAAALQLARDPEVRRVLAKIVEDELRHAALGWAFIRWALERLDADGRSRVEAALEAGLARARQPQPARRGVPEHGLLSGAMRQEVFSRAATETLEPTIAALRGAVAQAA